MDRRQKAILIISFLAFIGAMVGAYWFSQGQMGPGLDATQRFTAKPGTTRENAVALSTSKRPSTEDASAGSRAEDEDPLPVRSLSGTEGFQVSPDEIVVQQALNNPSPTQGLASLEKALVHAADADTRALIEVARGVLLSRLGEEHWANAQSAFERAAALAEDQRMRERVIEQYAQILIQREEFDAAETLLKRSVEAAERQHDTTLRLAVLLGSVYEHQHETSLAQETYEGVVEHLLREKAQWSLGAADLARLASLRLARIYRDVGAEREARKLARRIQARLAPEG